MSDATAAPASGDGAVIATARAVRTGRASVVETVREAIDRLTGAVALNVLADERYEAALLEAAALDDERASGRDLGLLAGVPVLVKDLTDVAGLPTRQGSQLLAHVEPSPRSAPIVDRLRAAGAVVVGKSTLPEFAIEGHTANLLTGVTRNPWDPRWTPGGSSGGSAAAVAAGLVPVATATDGGGSVRIPAAFCGLVGLKPTNGVVGRWPVPDWIDLSTDGVFATTVADLALLLDVVAGPVAGDPGSWPVTALPASRVDPPAPRLFVAERTSDLGPLPDDVRHCFDASVHEFVRLLGTDPITVAPGELFGDHDPDLDWFTIAGAEHLAALGRSRIESQREQLHVSSQEFFDAAQLVSIDEYLAARRRRFDVVRTLDLLLGDDGLLVTPTVAVSGILAQGWLPGDRSGLLPPHVYSTAVQNMSGLPALTLPATPLPDGRPFGLQITAPRWRDGWLLQLAAEWELRHPWQRHPDGYDDFATAWT
jgi:Asp-tRNA(Asn)/Glu-tRNA(Gln) amidotransferase A subunit family amidase